MRVWSPEDVLNLVARPGKRVVVLDEGGNWRGAGTAWWLAERGHDVTLVTPDALVGKELQRSAADFPLRRRLAALGVRFVVESAVAGWRGNGGGAEVVSLLTGKSEVIPANDLVMSTANRVDDGFMNDLAGRGVPFDRLGDAAAPRMAALAFHDGRKWALGL
jgi:NADPH-dependent 2,4-dienoyl-CoA reductase/sulfur reductase-like enzyme